MFLTGTSVIAKKSPGILLTMCGRARTPARKAVASYQSWFGEGPEVSTLRLLGLFDRPVNEKALGTLLVAPAIPDLTESLIDLSPLEWRTILARLRRVRLLAGEDPHIPGQLDAHPLVREYFGEQLRSERTEAWKENNKRLYHYYRTLAPRLPDSFAEMEPLFLAVICGCNAGLFHEVLHEVHILRFQRGGALFAANDFLRAGCFSRSLWRIKRTRQDSFPRRRLFWRPFTSRSFAKATPGYQRRANTFGRGGEQQRASKGVSAIA
jgi:hypothetical protein